MYYAPNMGSSKIINSRNILLSCSMGALYSSGIYISMLLSQKNTVLTHIYIYITAALLALAVISKETKTALVKWGVSVLPACLSIFFFNRTSYTIRALNMINPDYGRTISAKDAASLLYWAGVLSISCIFAIIVGLKIKPKDPKRFKILRRNIIITADVTVAAVVLITENMLPPMKSIL